ncbi:F-box only protein 15 [Plakobranchus ocellatus]|uniref:F-box only protein 15 n=1 Tax=Plakobranchus ocellatus TaxID=259542 RepID=A0AAV4A675_9GAST|nr:F-box only protein 15 [Plakobranchus ocellatus]
MASSNAANRHSSYLKQYLQIHSNRSLSTTPSNILKTSKTENSNASISAKPSLTRESTLAVKSSDESKSTKPLLTREATFTARKYSSNYDTLRQRPNTSVYTSVKSKIPANLKVLPHINGSKNRAMKASIECIPDEILSAIFWKLQIGDLITASQVCRRWYRVTGDNLLWKRYYCKFVGPTSSEPEDTMPIQELDRCCWKNLCLKRCKIKRDQIYLKKWKHPDSYTGLKQRPELTLGKVGVRFELSFLGPDSGSSGKPTHILSHDDAFWLTTSASVRWYGLVFPDVKMIKGFHIHACSPLMFYGPAKPAKDGADCYCDHVPMVGKFKLKLKKNSKPFTNIKFDLAILKTNQTIREQYQISVQNKFEALRDAEEVEQQWEKLQIGNNGSSYRGDPKSKKKGKA